MFSRLSPPRPASPLPIHTNISVHSNIVIRSSSDNNSNSSNLTIRVITIIILRRYGCVNGAATTLYLRRVYRLLSFVCMCGYVFLSVCLLREQATMQARVDDIPNTSVATRSQTDTTTFPVCLEQTRQ